MKTFWVNGRKSFNGGSIRSPIRPKSPIFDPSRKRLTQHEDPWPRHRSVPAVHTYKNTRKSLTPEKWPQLEESMSAPISNDNLGPRTSATSFIPGILASGSNSGSNNQEGIDLEDVGRIQRLSSLPTIPDELRSLASGNVNSLNEFAELAEENAQRSRQLANWAKHIATVAQNHSSTKENPSLSAPCTDTNSLETKNHSVSLSPRSSRLLGSSVDRSGSVPATPNQDRKYCIIS